MEESEQQNTKSLRKENLNYVLKSLQPALVVENILGIYRFRYVDGKLLPTDAKLKFIAVCITFSVVGLFYGFLRLPTALNGNEKLVDILKEAPSIVMLTQYVITAISTSFFFTDSNIKICSTFAQLDSLLHVNMNKNFYNKLRKQTYKFLFYLIICQIFFSVIDLSTGSAITVGKVIVFPLYLERDLEVMFFCKLISMLGYRLHIINKHLLKFILVKDVNKTALFVVNKDSTDVDFSWIGKISSQNMKIKDLSIMYDMIGEICSLINNVFNFQIFMTLVSCFTYIVIAIWSSLYYFRSADVSVEDILTIITWCTAEVCAVGSMSLVCEKLLLKRNECKVLINELIMDYDLPTSMRMQAKALMELTEAWPLKIFVYDMFSVDITLMLKFISVATTYLIVIIQVFHFA